MNDNVDPDVAAQQAGLLIERRRYAAARSIVAAGLLKAPRDEELLYLRAWVEFLDEKLDLAEKAALELLAVAPDSYSGRHVLFHIFRETKRLADAEKLVISLIRDYPQNPDAYALYSRLMLQTHNFDKAEALAQEALKLEPGGETALLSVALCRMVKGKISPDIDLVDLIKANPQSVSTIGMLVASLAQDNRTVEALRLAESLVRADPENADYIDIVVSLRTATHWLMKPLWPMQRFGWGASAVIWVIAVVGLNLARDTPYAPVAGYLSYLFFAYVVYSWVVPPLLTRWMKR